MCWPILLLPLFLGRWVYLILFEPAHSQVAREVHEGADEETDGEHGQHDGKLKPEWIFNMCGPDGFHVDGELPDVEVGEEDAQSKVEESLLLVSGRLELPHYLGKVTYTGKH